MVATDVAPTVGIEILLRLEREGALTEVGIDFGQVGELAFDRYEALGAMLGVWRDTTAWALGDWVNAGEGLYGEKYAQALEATGRSYSTMTKYAYVARRIELFRRRKNLTWSHHVEVAHLEPAEQNHWLLLAENEGWSRDRLRDELRTVTGKRPKAAQPAWTDDPAALSAGEREVVEAYRDLRDQFPKLVTPAAARAALEHVVVVDQTKVTCPACGHEFGPDNDGRETP